MGNLSNNVNNAFLMGVGLVATTAEAGKKVASQLVEKGREAVKQGQTENTELAHTVKKSVDDARSEILRQRMKLMNEQERAAFVKAVNQFAAEDASTQKDTQNAESSCACEADNAKSDDKCPSVKESSLSADSDTTECEAKPTDTCDVCTADKPEAKTCESTTSEK